MARVSTNSVHAPTGRSTKPWPPSAANAARSTAASGSVASTSSDPPGGTSSMRRLAIVSGRGQASPRASTVVTLRIVTAPAYSLTAVLATGELERLYSGLSVLVSAASAGERCAALASFRALEALMAEDLFQRAEEPSATPALSWVGRDTFARSLLELRETALDLEGLEVYACSASVDTMSLTAGAIEERLRGVLSTPRFLERAAGARLLFV